MTVTITGAITDVTAHKDAEFHYLLEQNRILGAVTWGNPCRERGVANGNDYAGWPTDDSGGIGDDLVVDTPDWWLDFAHTAGSPWGRDIYTATPFSSSTQGVCAAGVELYPA